MNTPRVLLLVALASAPVIAEADPNCPDAVTAAAKKAFPDATVTKCIAETAGFEVTMQRKDKSIVELDISAKGEIEQIEEVVSLAAIPAVVSKAFAAKYPKAAMLRAEKQTKADKTVSYEIAFESRKDLKEATFKDDGTFVEED